MIFPRMRLSELRQDVEQSRNKWDASVGALKDGIKAKANPLTFLKEHPKFLFSLFLSVASSTGLLQKMIGRSFGRNGSTRSRSGKLDWIMKIAGMSTHVVGKAVIPMGIAAIRLALRKATRALRDHRN